MGRLLLDLLERMKAAAMTTVKRAAERNGAVRLQLGLHLAVCWGAGWMVEVVSGATSMSVLLGSTIFARQLFCYCTTKTKEAIQVPSAILLLIAMIGQSVPRPLVVVMDGRGVADSASISDIGSSVHGLWFASTTDFEWPRKTALFKPPGF